MEALGEVKVPDDNRVLFFSTVEICELMQSFSDQFGYAGIEPEPEVGELLEQVADFKRLFSELREVIDAASNIIEYSIGGGQ